MYNAVIVWVTATILLWKYSSSFQFSLFKRSFRETRADVNVLSFRVDLLSLDVISAAQYSNLPLSSAISGANVISSMLYDEVEELKSCWGIGPKYEKKKKETRLAIFECDLCDCFI